MEKFEWHWTEFPLRRGGLRDSVFFNVSGYHKQYKVTEKDLNMLYML